MSQLQVKITENLVSDFSESLTWTKDELLKTTINLTAEEDYSFDLTKISNIKLIVVKSNSPFSVSLTKDYITSTITVENMFLLTPQEVDRDLLTDLTISALNLTSDTYTILIYGEE